MLIAGHPVAVSCVHPGGIKTNIARNARASEERNAGRDKEKDAADFARVARTTPEQAATIILKGVDKKKARILVGPDAYMFDAVARGTGSGYQRLVAAAAKRAPDRFIV
jgi:short-subunit dehydrogenase